LLQVSLRLRRAAARTVAAAASLYLLLLIPPSEPEAPKAASNRAFAWKQDERWSALEARFNDARRLSHVELAARIGGDAGAFAAKLDSLESRPYEPSGRIFQALENHLFELAPLVAASPSHLPMLIQLQSRLRSLVKQHSQHWDMTSPVTRQTMYRLLYGSRAAVEEVVLQASADSIPGLISGDDEPSSTPSTRILGVTIHSGDILVSRGGAPTSALIARGNDFPGNFSHVALAHVDESTGIASLIESHIERGVVLSTPEAYLRDKKLRVMVLRLRADLPALKEDPLLPHRAAIQARQAVDAQHVPYDFEMDFRDHHKLFCSEVAASAYESQRVQLWMGISRISSPGVRSWLAAFGVTHFETQEPADLEYDPQLYVVAEWRDPETLFKDHVDNAVIDAMLENADNGERLRYAWNLLPVGRLMKAYSWLLNRFGSVGPIPEGMDAAAALRHKQFNAMHTAIQERTLALAREFKARQGYVAPYWELLKLARRAAEPI